MVKVKKSMVEVLLFMRQQLTGICGSINFLAEGIWLIVLKLFFLFCLYRPASDSES